MKIGIRLSKEQGTQFMQEHQTTVFRSYGAVMKEYVLVPEKLIEDFKLLSSYLNDSYTYAKSLKPKNSKK